MRLGQLEARLGERIEIEWKSFMLRPRPGRRTREEFVAYTESWRRPAAMEPAAELRPWATADDPPSHSLPALVAAKVAAGFGRDAYDAYHLALLRAYFAENRTISTPAVQAEIADEVGIGREAFADRLAAERDDCVEVVLAEHESAVNNGITAVPTVLLGDVLAVPGAQDVEVYERLITKITERRAG